ncbi:outer membrane protein assembly factor BamA [Perlabentimonas gracilis]|uniref:outer membrane protein assembly factor BamA n=1 Tax=Perlabentimonas gracilis TaxID=2715279 RepID=UPI00140D5A11|nr:outer membrane protein assembly factor BamA [Perlabentimonas gracilis]NHB69278.1 outer membrane protein assembly factor BamA [Perlabentimonas gracilis]
MIKKLAISIASFLIAAHFGYSQTSPFSYTSPEEYTLKGVTVSGIRFIDPNVIVSMSGLYIGDKISVPSETITGAINKLWDQGLFSDIKITATKIEGDDIYLDIFLQELPRISGIDFIGIRKSEEKDLVDLIKLRIGGQATENILDNSKRLIKNHYRSKAYLNANIDIHQQHDTLMANGVRLIFNIDKGPKVRISDITFEGNDNIIDRKLRRAMKNTKRRDLNFFKASKFVENDFEEDKRSLIAYYNQHGYRDAKVLGDSVFVTEENRIGLIIKVEEGPKYHYRDINWVGNSKLPDEILDDILGIRKGDVYDKTLLEERLFIDDNSITTTYMDDGHLFFSIEPVEIRVANDSIDLEMRIYEGKQATVNNVIVKGNTKTHENVIRRELFTKPGDLFSKTGITRSVRELATMGHFDPEKLDVTPLPNMADGTVDLVYTVEEKANDQLEVSGGWGNKMFVGTIGIRFSNFSIGRLFEKQAWRPVPSGDSQTLSLRAQTNGSFYKAFSLTFVEPWLGGRKPTNFTLSLYHTINNLPGTYIYQVSDQRMKVTGGAIGIGTRLKWPDDWFQFYNELSIQSYDLNKWDYFMISTGKSNNFSYKAALTRNSIDQLIYPRRGSNFNLTLQLTPPYSIITGKDFSNVTDLQEKYKWIEYHKWTGKAQWFHNLVDNLVLYTGAQFGYLGYYNKDIGYSPFEGFDLGGDGMSGYNLYGRETIGLRGYENSSLSPRVNGVVNANVYTKYTVELRYPITLQPQAAIYLLTFLEAGNAWYEFRSINPFNVHRSAGVGARVFLPMIGMLGIDWGYGFDKIPHNPDKHRGQFHFTIGQNF